ncbi:MAG: hypothetical protein RLO01_19775 [Thalassobaculaceae bacterium]
MNPLNTVWAGILVASSAAVAPSLSPSLWLLAAAILVDLHRSDPGTAPPAAHAGAGWLALIAAALFIAFGGATLIALGLMVAGALCRTVSSDTPGRAAGAGIGVLGLWLVGRLVVAPAVADHWIAAEAAMIGELIGRPTHGAVIGAGHEIMVLLTGCSGLPVSVDVGLAAYAAGRLLGTAPRRAAVVATLGAAAMFVLNVARLCAMAGLAGAYDLLHTDTVNQLAGAGVLAAVAASMMAGRRRS